MLPIRTRKLSIDADPAVQSLRDATGQSLTRAMTIGAISVENRTVELAFSSEAEIDRWGDIEILDHSAGAIDFVRLNGGASLLFNHKPSDVIGVVESARIDPDRKGRAIVRFGKGARADEIFQDVQDGILRNVSVGYMVRAVEMTEKRSNGTYVYTVTKWEPFEISIVTIPVDTTVGVQRNLTPEKSPNRNIMNRAAIIGILRARGIAFEDSATDDQLGELLTRSLNNETLPPTNQPSPRAPITSNAGETEERVRTRSIMEIGRKYKLGEEASRAVEEGTPFEEFRAAALEALDKRSAAMTESNRGIGLSESEADQFSFVKLIRSVMDPTNKSYAKDAAFELEVTMVAAEKMHRQARGIVIPADVLNRPLQRANTDTVSIKTGTGYTGTGGATVATTLLTQSFVELLRHKTTIVKNSRVITGLVGNFDIPKQTKKTSGYWIGEDDSAPKDNVDFGTIGLRPHTVANLAEITRRMLMQSSLDVEAFVRADLAAGIAQAIDYAGYYGDNTNNAPLGIKNTPGVIAVPFVAVQPTFAELVAMETALDEVNIDTNTSRYIARSTFRGYAKTTQKFAGGGNTGTIWEPGGTVNGYATDITNQIVNGDVFFGDFSEFIVGMWGGLEITVDPYTHSDKGRLRIVCMQDIDFEARRPEAFAYGKKPA